MSRFVRTAIITTIVSVMTFGIVQTANAQRGMHRAGPMSLPAFRGVPSMTGGVGVLGGVPGIHYNPYRIGNAFERRLWGSGMSPYLLASYVGGGYAGGYGGYGGGYGGYGASPFSSAYGGWITAAPTNDSRDYIALQQAALSNRFMAQDLKEKKLQHRRAVFDEMRYEQENSPTLEDIREEMRMQQLARARNGPPEKELVTGAPLNVLLDSVQRMQARENVIGYAIPLDPEIVKHINVATNKDGKASNEFFRPGNLPEWPVAFDNAGFTEDKKKFAEDLFAMGKSQIDGKINVAKVSDARKTLANMRENLFLLRFSVTSNDYIDGLTYLTKLSDTVETLAKPDGKKFLDGTFSAKGETVGDLLSYMTGKGLRFAKASPGSESYYAALYQALATYEWGMNRTIAKK